MLDYLRRITCFTNLKRTSPLLIGLILHDIDQICVLEPTFTISSLTVHRFITSAVSLSSKSHCDASCTNARTTRALVASCPPQAHFLTAINWCLACTREVLQLYYVNLVAHSYGNVHMLSSSPYSPASSAAAAPTPTTPSTTTTTARATNLNHPSSTSSTGGASESNPSALPDETTFDSSEDGASGGGVASDGGGANMGTISPIVAAAAGLLPPPFGGPDGVSFS